MKAGNLLFSSNPRPTNGGILSLITLKLQAVIDAAHRAWSALPCPLHLCGPCSGFIYLLSKEPCS